jgi:chromosome segregation ATPase
MDPYQTIKAKKSTYKLKLNESIKEVQALQRELEQVRQERDKAIGEKCLAQAKLKEQDEEVCSLQLNLKALESSYITMKIEHANLKSNYESLKDDHEIVRKMICIRDNEIKSLTNIQNTQKKIGNLVPKAKESLKPPINKNIKPFPSSSFSFNLYSNNKPSHSSSWREDDH